MTERLTKAQLRLLSKHKGIDAVFEYYEAVTREMADHAAALEERIAALERRLGMNSRNSSKPPSSDQPRPAPKSQRKKTGRKTGGQPGHEGHTLERSSDPDTVHEIPLPSGPLCDAGCTKESSLLLPPEVRQVADLPPIQIQFTEYRAERVRGSCGHIHSAGFPEGVSAAVQYGANVKAAALYLSNYHLVPQERTCRALADLFGAAMSEGTLNRIIAAAHSRLEPSSAAIEEALSREAVLDLDETGTNLSGKLWWQHCASSELFTHYGFHPLRGIEGTEWSSPFLVWFSGVAVHDGWKSYFGLPWASHALCNAHHLRELEGIIETTGQTWAKEMQQLLRDMLLEVQAALGAGEQALSPERQAYWRSRYRDLVRIGLLANPAREPPPDSPRKRVSQTPARNLLLRLEEHEEATLAFMTDFRIPFSNNQAERDLRMTKVKQKISGCFRSLEGAKAFFRIRGYISTLQKQGANVMEYLTRVFEPGSPEVLLPQS